MTTPRGLAIAAVGPIVRRFTLLLCGLWAMVASAAEPHRPTAQLTLTISRDRAGGIVIPRDFVGLSYETSAVSQPIPLTKNASLQRFLRVFGPYGVLRFGGETSDYTSFVPSDSRVRNAASFAAALGPGWSVLWGLNYAKHDPQAAGRQAAAWTSIYPVQRTLFQIGNEPNYYMPRIAYADYASRWQLYHDAVAAAVPGARFAGPDLGQHSGTWLAQFAADKGHQTELLTVHLYWYKGNPAESQYARNIAIMSDDLAQEVGRADAAISASSGLRLRMTEGGSVHETGVGNTQAGAMWDLQLMMSFAAHGWAGVNLHEGDNTAPAAPQNGYLPYVRNPDGASYAPQSPLYAMLMMERMAGGRIIPVLGRLPGSLSALAVIGEDGKARLLILNRNPSTAVSLDIGARGKISGATLLEMQAPSPDAANATTINGTMVTADGNFAPPPRKLSATGGHLILAVPASSAELLTIE